MISALIDLRGQLDAWIRTRLWAQVLAGLVLGILVGYLLGPDLNWVERDTSRQEINGRASQAKVKKGS